MEQTLRGVLLILIGLSTLLTARHIFPPAYASVRVSTAHSRRCFEYLLGGATTPRHAVPSDYEVRGWGMLQVQPPGAVQVRLPFDLGDQALWAESLANESREVGRFYAFDQDGHLLYRGPWLVGEHFEIGWDVAKRAFAEFLGALRRGGVSDRIHRIRFTHTHPPRFWLNVPGLRLPRFTIPHHLSASDLLVGAMIRSVMDDVDLPTVYFEFSAVTVLPERPWRRRERPMKSTVLYLPKRRD